MIPLSSNIQPRNATHPDPVFRGTYWLLEDIYVKGGFQLRDNLDSRNAIPENNRKRGMWVKTIEDNKIWELQADLITWREVKFESTSNALPRRQIDTYITQNIEAGSFHDFVFNIGPTCLLLSLSVDKSCIIEAHSTLARVDTNPYIFVANENKLNDDGLTLMADNTIIKNRRYSILCNLEQIPNKRIYFRVINPAGPIISVKIVATSLVIESL